LITVANRIYVNPDYAEAFEARFKDRAGLVDQMPGFVANYVLRPTGEGEPYVVLTLWESRSHFEAWVNSDEFRQGHGRSGTLPAEAFTRRNQMELHEVISASERL
jgi:heme oxygenase (mycobilin-producing)